MQSELYERLKRKQSIEETMGLAKEVLKLPFPEIEKLRARAEEDARAELKNTSESILNSFKKIQEEHDNFRTLSQTQLGLDKILNNIDLLSSDSKIANAIISPIKRVIASLNELPELDDKKILSEIQGKTGLDLKSQLGNFKELANKLDNRELQKKLVIGLIANQIAKELPEKLWKDLPSPLIKALESILSLKKSIFTELENPSDVKSSHLFSIVDTLLAAMGHELKIKQIDKLADEQIAPLIPGLFKEKTEYQLAQKDPLELLKEMKKNFSLLTDESKHEATAEMMGRIDSVLRKVKRSEEVDDFLSDYKIALSNLNYVYKELMEEKKLSPAGFTDKVNKLKELAKTLEEIHPDKYSGLSKTFYANKKEFMDSLRMRIAVLEKLSKNPTLFFQFVSNEKNKEELEEIAHQYYGYVYDGKTFSFTDEEKKVAKKGEELKSLLLRSRIIDLPEKIKEVNGIMESDATPKEKFTRLYGIIDDYKDEKITEEHTGFQELLTSLQKSLLKAVKEITPSLGRKHPRTEEAIYPYEVEDSIKSLTDAISASGGMEDPEIASSVISGLEGKIPGNSVFLIENMKGIISLAKSKRILENPELRERFNSFLKSFFESRAYEKTYGGFYSKEEMPLWENYIKTLKELIDNPGIDLPLEEKEKHRRLFDSVLEYAKYNRGTMDTKEREEKEKIREEKAKAIQGIMKAQIREKMNKGIFDFDEIWVKSRIEDEHDKLRFEHGITKNFHSIYGWQEAYKDVLAERVQEIMKSLDPSLTENEKFSRINEELMKQGFSADTLDKDEVIETLVQNIKGKDITGTFSHREGFWKVQELEHLQELLEPFLKKEGKDPGLIAEELWDGFAKVAKENAGAIEKTSDWRYEASDEEKKEMAEIRKKLRQGMLEESKSVFNKQGLDFEKLPLDIKAVIERGIRELSRKIRADYTKKVKTPKVLTPKFMKRFLDGEIKFDGWELTNSITDALLYPKGLLEKGTPVNPEDSVLANPEIGTFQEFRTYLEFIKELFKEDRNRIPYKWVEMKAYMNNQHLLKQGGFSDKDISIKIANLQEEYMNLKEKREKRRESRKKREEFESFDF